MLADAAFWALIGLIGFFAIVIYMKVPGAIGTALDGRAKAISDELDQARKLREDAEALLADYKRRALEAEAEAAQIVDQARREAEALTGEAKRRLEEYVTARTKVAEQKIAQAEHQAVQDVKALSADVAVAAAQSLLSARMKGDAAASLVEKAIADVKAKLN